MAQIDNTLGITPCMPILEERQRYGSRFFGALCQDILLTDQTKYFNIDVETKRFIFKKDAKFDEAAEEKYFLGFDTMTSKARQDIILESKFYSDLTQQLNDNNAFSDQGLFTIDYLNIGVDQTRLFNDEYVKWGVMRMKSSSDDFSS